MPNPIRIYVLLHPDSVDETGDGGRKRGTALLAERIYDWFRQPSLEGVPVYLRSDPRPGGALARDADSFTSDHWPRLPDGCDEENSKVLEYLVPLVEAHLVRDPSWRAYLEHLAKHASATGERRIEKGKEKGQWPLRGAVMFPVAMDNTAYNLGPTITKRNFIRHQASGSTPAEQEEAVRETLKFLTEALARDLNLRLFPKQAGEKLQIFISYARADGTDTAKALRRYIDGQTQCRAFLDENDIAFGAEFERTLQKGVGEEARALLVIQGDHYADRPWCRWELAKFLAARGATKGAGQSTPRVFYPALVLESQRGAGMTRILPEVAGLPTLRWEKGRERECFSTLMREVFYGGRNYLAALQIQRSSDALIVNRLPGPLTLHKLLRECPEAKRIHYPGNGLSLLDLNLLKENFREHDFVAFADIRDAFEGALEKSPARSGRAPKSSGKGARAVEKSRGGQRQTLIISVGDSDQLASLGYRPEHIRELLVYLLRPLVRRGCDLIYAGKPPMEKMDGAEEWRANRTLTMLDLIRDEQEYHDQSQLESHSKTGRIFNVVAWPNYLSTSPTDEASWVRTCSLTRFSPAKAGLDPELPEKSPTGELSAHYLATAAYTLSMAREYCAKGFTRAVPGNSQRRVRATAYIGLAGKTQKFTGVMPGIFEEFLCAMQAKVPIYLIGGLGGAAGILAQALRSGTKGMRELTEGYYESRERAEMQAGLRALGRKGKSLAQVRDAIEDARADKFANLRNGLDEADNLELLETLDTSTAVRLIWRGLMSSKR